MSNPSSISEEISEAKNLFPSVRVITATHSFLIATYERSPYTRMKMTLTFPEGYPSHSLIVNIDQDAVVPPGLKKKLEKEMNSLASQKAERAQFDQIRYVWEHMVSFIDGNLFVPCWKELKKCVDLVQNSNAPTKTTANTKQSTLSIVSESKGKIRLTLHNEAYYYKCTITIDPAYPDYSAATGGKSCLLQVQSTNFPSPIETMLTTQAQEIVRRMQEGLSSERALNMSNPIKVPKDFHLNTAEFKEGNMSRLTNETIQNIKHDTEALKRVSDLHNKEASAVRAPGGYVNKKALAKERKDARRTIHKITEAERAADLKAEEKEREWKLEEKKRLVGYYDLYDVPAGGTIVPQPSLFVLVTFLVDRVKGLVLQQCPCCEKRVLPVNPDELNSMYVSSSMSTNKDKQASKLKKKMIPMHTYCGCWYHKSCLHTFITEPPFGLECPTINCGKRVFHPHWPGDIKQMERDWAARQARMREVEDAMMFL
eukprot:CAMPEP_0172323434 /NCGR_PEP_ID=MMETSP1058-20130122/48732_1 /TAXON_ID=83371 /ORGANISM="Detonula confervacea, Strain CCMP 353" /LENGTH=483 /DNA_ID=CAMNT_0013039429 /DNA_START=76 /DNA_END=1527 /DNA_ORIENTATION=-